MTLDELNQRFIGPTYDETLLDSEWHVLWTGWKTSPANELLVAQWIAASKTSTKIYVSSTPGKPQITEKGYQFDICSRDWVAQLTLPDFMLGEKELMKKAEKARGDALVRLILLMERDGAFEEEGE